LAWRAGRYCILLMSIFSIYTELIYNECFSVPMAMFGRGHWACPGKPDAVDRVAMHFQPDLCPEAFNKGLVNEASPYPFGVDPTWHGSRTELQFLNSLKMKMSIILGAPGAPPFLRAPAPVM